MEKTKNPKIRQIKLVFDRAERQIEHIQQQQVRQERRPLDDEERRAVA